MKQVHLAITLVLAALTHVTSAADDPDLPSFLGYVGLTNEQLFLLEWGRENERPFHAWLRMGGNAGTFKLSSFDPEKNVLSVEGRDQRVYPLSLPGSRMQGEVLTDAEYKELFAYYSKFEKRHDAPILSREKARAFLIRLVTERALKQPVPNDGRNVTIDLEGSSLPPERREKWDNDVRRALKENRVLLVVVIDGKPVVTRFPLRIDEAPERMVRNLEEADWEEIALLNATLTLKNILGGPRK